jgi:hypothetical protein
LLPLLVARLASVKTSSPPIFKTVGVDGCAGGRSLDAAGCCWQPASRAVAARIPPNHLFPLCMHILKNSLVVRNGRYAVPLPAIAAGKVKIILRRLSEGPYNRA